MSVYASHQFSESSGVWTVFGKSNLLVAQLLDTSYQKKGSEVRISGHHKMTVTGAFNECTQVYNKHPLVCLADLGVNNLLHNF